MIPTIVIGLAVVFAGGAMLSFHFSNHPEDASGHERPGWDDARASVQAPAEPGAEDQFVPSRGVTSPGPRELHGSTRVRP